MEGILLVLLTTNGLSFWTAWAFVYIGKQLCPIVGQKYQTAWRGSCALLGISLNDGGRGGAHLSHYTPSPDKVVPKTVLD